MVREITGIRLVLEKQNEAVGKMLSVMQKPENRFIGFLKVAVLVAGVLGVLGTVQIVRLWILGG